MHLHLDFVRLAARSSAPVPDWKHTSAMVAVRSVSDGLLRIWIGCQTLWLWSSIPETGTLEVQPSQFLAASLQPPGCFARRAYIGPVFDVKVAEVRRSADTEVGSSVQKRGRLQILGFWVAGMN